MTTSSQQFENFVPLYNTIPDSWEDVRPILLELLKKYGNAINLREVAWFIDAETQTGGQFIPGTNAPTNQYRNVLRKVVNFGALPNATTKSVAHGLLFDANFSLLHLYAGATDPVAFTAIPLGYPSFGTDDVRLDLDSTNINVTTMSDYTNYTTCYVTIEFIQEL